jgi:hypothetical protein
MTVVAMAGMDEAQRTLAGMPDRFIALDHATHRILSYVTPAADGVEAEAAVRSWPQPALNIAHWPRATTALR